MWTIALVAFTLFMLAGWGYGAWRGGGDNQPVGGVNPIPPVGGCSELRMRNQTGGPATIVQHCAVFGEHERAVQWWRVGDVMPYAQYDCSVAVTFGEPGKRGRRYFTIAPDNTRYLTVVAAG